MQADLILYAVVAAGLVFWLRSILGTKHGGERERSNPFAQTGTEAAGDVAQAARIPATDTPGLPLPDEKLFLPKNVTLASGAIEQDIAKLRAADAFFDLPRFCAGAQDAFAMIVEAFAAKDRDLLKNLLEPPVYTAFDTAIKTREAAGQTMTSEIHAVKSMELIDVRFDLKQIFVKVRFIAEETCVIRDAGGNILSGDPDRITQMNDVWTFTRALRSKDPTWFVHETSDGDVTEDQKTPLPDAK